MPPLPDSLPARILAVLRIAPLTFVALKPHFPQTPRSQLMKALRDLQIQGSVKQRSTGAGTLFAPRGQHAKVKGQKPRHADNDIVIFKPSAKPSSSWWTGKSRLDFSTAMKERFAR